MIWLGAGALAWLTSMMVSGISFIALELFDGPTGSYFNLPLPESVFLLAPVLGAIALVPARLATAGRSVLVGIASAPLAIQAAMFLIFIRTGAWA